MSDQVKELGITSIVKPNKKQIPAKSPTSRARMKAKAVRLRKSGVVVREIADQFGVFVALVYQWLRQETSQDKVLPTPKRLRIKSEATTTISGASSEKAKIIFTSGVILEMPASHISGSLLKVLSEVQ